MMEPSKSSQTKPNKKMKLLYWNNGMLNDIKIERLRKSGILLNQKKKMNFSLKVVNLWANIKKPDNFVKLKRLLGKNLKRLEAYYDIIRREKLFNLCNYLQKTQTLDAFTIRFKAGEEFKDREVTRLGNSFKGLRNLRKLDIEIIDPVRLSDRGFKDFAAGFSHLENLQDLALNIENCQVSSKSVSILTKNLANLSQIKSIELSLVELTNITDEVLMSLADSVSHLKKLESFTLDVSWCSGITDKSFSILNNALSELKTIMNYSFTSRKCAVAQQTAFSLIKMFNSLTQLRTIQLDMYGCPHLMTENISEMFKGLSNMKHLTKLVMYIGPGIENLASFGDEEIRILGGAISNLECLKEIKLTLCEFLKITNEGLNDFGVLASQIKGLEGVELRFSSCRSITKIGIDELGKQLAMNKSITKVMLFQ